MNLKVLIVILVLLASLFIWGLSMGANADNTSAEGGSPLEFLNAPWVTDLKARFSSRLDITDVSLVATAPAGCILQGKQFTIPADLGSPCLFAIAPAGEDGSQVRALTLRTIQGTNITLELEQPNADDALVINQELAINDSIALDIYEPASFLSLGPCVLPEDSELTACILEAR